MLTGSIKISYILYMNRFLDFLLLIGFFLLLPGLFYLLVCVFFLGEVGGGGWSHHCKMYDMFKNEM